jgi:hypothetical protein
MPPPPFFIVGFQRSGTTLLRVMLDNHPEIAIPLDTTGLWIRYDHRLESEYNGLSTEDDVRRLVSDLLAEERIRLWGIPLEADRIVAAIGPEPSLGRTIDAFHRAYAAARGKSRWGDKDPGNMVRMHRINDWFPDAQFLHIIRDGRDACLSQLEVDFGYDDVLPCACDWREQVEWVRRIGAILGLTRYLEVKYEDLVKQPEAVLKRVCAFLAADYDPQMLEYHRRVEKSVPDSKRHIWPKIGQPPRSDNAERWKREMSPGQVICFEKRAGRLLSELGYEVTPGPWSGAYLTELGSMARHTWRAVRGRVGRAPGGADAPDGRGAV